MSGFINLDGKKILVVEDDEMNFIYLKQIFKITKGEITRAKDGQDALEAFASQEFDLILMDIQLPDISGNEVTKIIRESNKEIPIIAQTAHRTPDEISGSIEAGCNSVLTKPFKIQEFSDAIKKFIG